MAILSVASKTIKTQSNSISTAFQFNCSQIHNIHFASLSCYSRVFYFFIITNKVIIFVSNNTIIKAVKGNFMKKALLILVIISIFSSCKDQTTEPPVVQYAYVTIGSQVWTTRNLDVDKYRNGDSIPEVKDPKEWYYLKTGAWCYYKNDPAMGAIYGKIYNWYAVNDPRGLAPSGWHIPSDDEWTTLITYLGGQSVAGGKLKETSTSHWKSPNKFATNESGFSALPGGYCDYLGISYNIGDYGYWWSSTEGSNNGAWNRYVYYYYASVYRSNFGKDYGFYVRCVRDSI